MPAPQITSILSLPTDVLTLTSSYLGQAVVPFRGLCRRFRAVSLASFEAYKNKLFIDRNGTRAECEKDIPLGTLIERIKSAAAIQKKLKSKLNPAIETVGHYEPKLERHLAGYKDLWLEMDSSLVPRLMKFKKVSFFKKDASIIERLKTKYRLYRREFHRERDEKINRLIRQQNAAARELDSKPFNALHLLQDLRNRCRRLQTLELERTSLSHAVKASRGSYNDFLSKLTLMEKVFFYVISWFHSWVKKPYVELEIPPLPVRVQSLNQGIKLSETKMTFQGQEIPLEIKAHIGLAYDGTFTHRTVFAIHQQNDPIMLGYFEIAKAWTHIRPDNRTDELYSEKSINAGKFVGRLINPRLYIDHFNDLFQQDTTNGDRPIMRLLTQIAVEIFQLEVESTLEIWSHDADVFFAGGFAMLDPDGRENRIKGDIQRARERDNLFPSIANRDLGYFQIYLGKSPTNSSSKFVTYVEKGKEQPASVDFDFDHPPITWEEQIKAHRLLPEKGPILPRFFYQDLSRFEKPTQVPETKKPHLTLDAGSIQS